MENWELAGHGGPECFETDDGFDGGKKKEANCFAWCRVNTENMTERGADERSGIGTLRELEAELTQGWVLRHRPLGLRVQVSSCKLDFFTRETSCTRSR